MNQTIDKAISKLAELMLSIQESIDTPKKSKLYTSNILKEEWKKQAKEIKEMLEELK